jgi:hypothetical protein
MFRQQSAIIRELHDPSELKKIQISIGSYMFRQQSAIIRELLDLSELHENTDRYGGLSYNVG